MLSVKNKWPKILKQSIKPVMKKWMKKMLEFNKISNKKE